MLSYSCSCICSSMLQNTSQEGVHECAFMHMTMLYALSVLAAHLLIHAE